ncbi:MAG TPA: (Fe-S)-binding protein [Rhodanobacteraceae bacterium]|nr:(Fe-S)-binding protein [Rhodanobacteraceae bacterium]
MAAHPAETASESRFEAPAAPRSEAPAERRIAALADQCVMCGLCLPHCPTYRISLDEAESPRGRIALARSIATGRIPASGTALAHLDQCLACLSCEKVCPSEVRYGEIITGTRALLASRRPRRGFLGRLLEAPERLVVLARVGAAVRARAWLPALARALPRGSRWRALAEQVPRVPALPALRAAAKRDRGAVTLFRGCVASVYDRDTHAAATQLLEALGYDVEIPAGTPCCGALARHAGEADSADRQSAATRAALAGAKTVLVSASGCFGDLRDHAGVAAADILAFLARDERIDTLRFKPLGARIAIHLPCTQVNVVGDTGAARALLARIPGVTLVDVPLQPRCCGAAGSYFIEQPRIAARLRDEKLDQVDAERPDVLVTTNIGCRIHLAIGLDGRGAATEVLHPLALLARQLDNAAS